VKRQQNNASRNPAAKRVADATKPPASQSPGDSAPAPPAASSDGDKPEANKPVSVKDEIPAANGTAPKPNGTASQNGSMPPPSSTQTAQPRFPHELVEDIMNGLKTAFPLLALTMEKMVDNISLRSKPTPDEDIYRFFAALLADALQVSRILLAWPTLSPLVRNKTDILSNGLAEVLCRTTTASSTLLPRKILRNSRKICLVISRCVSVRVKAAGDLFGRLQSRRIS